MRTITTQVPDDVALTLDQPARTEGRSKSWLVRSALADFIAKRQEVDSLTLEGLEAARRGDVVAHDEVLKDLDEWGHRGA